MYVRKYNGNKSCCCCSLHCKSKALIFFRIKIAIVPHFPHWRLYSLVKMTVVGLECRLVVTERLIVIKWDVTVFMVF